MPKGLNGLLASAVIICLVFCASASAQVCDGVALCDETIAADFFGVGARAMAMGNTGITLARDGSAMIYNPAALARLKRMEFQAGLSHFRGENDSRIWRSDEQFVNGDELNKTRLNAIALTVPVPTYRGSMVFAFGLNRVGSFDRALGRHARTLFGMEPLLDSVVWDSSGVLETGSMWKWTAAGAVDISPRLSAGASLHLITGGDEFITNGERFVEKPVDGEDVLFRSFFDQTIEVDYLGVAATVGMTYAVSPSVSAGIVVETPTYLTAEELNTDDLFEQIDTLSSDTDPGTDIFYDQLLSYSDFNVTRPFVFGFGLAGTFDRVNVAADFRYTDWTQMGFAYDDPALEVDEAATKRFIKDELTDVLSIHLGGEVLFPEQGVAVRAGYFRDPLPVDGRFIESQRQYLTAGVGVLVDRIMTVDIAYVHGGYELRDFDPGSYFAEYKIRRIFATFSYRI